MKILATCRNAKSKQSFLSYIPVQSNYIEAFNNWKYLTNISGLLLTTCDIFKLTHILHIVEHLLAWHNLDMLPLSQAYLLASHCFIKANWVTILQSIQQNNHSTTDVPCTWDFLCKIFKTCHEADVFFTSNLLNSWECVCYKYKPAWITIERHNQS